jgi:hypothetical protein
MSSNLRPMTSDTNTTTSPQSTKKDLTPKFCPQVFYKGARAPIRVPLDEAEFWPNQNANEGALIAQDREALLKNQILRLAAIDMELLTSREIDLLQN